MDNEKKTEEEKPVYNPEKWRELSDDGHVTRGECPCGAKHDMIDRSDKKRTST